jgi:starch-binding outer membrane protein SusE/F
MKNITRTIFAFLAILTIACTTDDVQNRPVIEGIDSPVLSAPESGNTYALLPENMTNQAERFVWSSANYNGAVEIQYTLEMDLEGGDFSMPQVLGGTLGALQLSVSVETLNNACLALGAAPYTPATFDVRVVSSASGFDMMASNKVTITISPYTTETPTLAVPGNHQGWDPTTAPLLASSGFGETDFEGYVWLDGEYKFVEKNAAGAFEWGNTDYGDDGSFSGVLVEQNETNCSVTTAGYYKVNANTTTLLYSSTLTNWGIIGSATPTGWDSDTNLTYDSNTKKWSVIINLIGGQEIKFRANDDWGLNYGDTGADGSLNEGGDNIAVGSSGSYLVELDLSNPRAYTYTLTLQ